MIWAGIIGDELVGHVRVPRGIKLSSATCCQFLKDVLEPWLEEIPLSQLKKVVFMHDNAPCHAAKAAIKCLQDLGFKDKQGLGFKDKMLMAWSHSLVEDVAIFASTTSTDHMFKTSQI